MSITCTVTNTSLVYRIDGRMDLHNSSMYEHAILEEFKRRTYTEIIINCEKLHYIDSSAIGAFLRIAKAAKDKNAGFLLDCPSDKVRKVLKLGNFIDYFEIHD